MKLAFFDRRFVQNLRESAAANHRRYGTSGDWIVELGGAEGLHESRTLVDPPPMLLFDNTSTENFDAENSKRIYRWLDKLSPIMAMDERLWAYLTHIAFAEYMSVRWPASGERAIRRRYLLEGRSFAALSRNGIARLWWAGYLTFDSARANQFELTETLFLRQDIQVSLLERSIGKSRKVRTGVLEYIRENSEWLDDSDFGWRIQTLLRELNLFGGVVVLDALPAAAIRGFLVTVGSSFKSPSLPA